MSRSSFGLRFHIIASLALLITLLGGLLGFAIVSISSAAIIKERKAAVRYSHVSAARSLAFAIATGSIDSLFEDVASSWLAGGSIDGIWVMDGSGNVRAKMTSDLMRGVTPVVTFPATLVYETVRIKTDETVRDAGGHLFTQFPAGRGLGCVIVGTHASKLAGSYTYLGSLLTIYLLVHGIAILAFGFFSLTYLIVRPIEKLRIQATRLGEGKFAVEAPHSVAKEIQEMGEALTTAASRLQKQHNELVEKIEELERARAEILKSQEAVLRSQKLASVGRLTAGVAHEIGNPLTAIIGFIDILQDPDLPDDTRREFLARMRDEAQRVSRTIRDLLTYARAEGKEKGRADLAEVVKRACDIMAPQKLFRKVKIEVSTPPGGLPQVAVGADRMTQVLVNLLLNAAEAMVGDGTIRIVLDSVEDGKMVKLSVEDDGPGIPPEISDVLFEPFVTTKPEGQGTGLGLSVCHGIVTSVGGTIRAENRSEGGARFVIHLPTVA